MAVAAGGSAHAASTPTLDLKVLLIGNGPTDPTTAAWQSALSSEGVPYTLATAAGTAPAQTVTLPALSSGTTGNFNGVVIADDPADFASGQLTALDAYESAFGVRQLDGYTYPTPVLGLTEASGGVLDGTTGTLSAAGLSAFPELSGPISFDTGTYGFSATVNSGAPFTPFITNSAGNVLAGVYQHPSTDPQAGVSELELSFDYNENQFQWLLLAPGLINWVTQNTHLGLYRNYFGQDIDDNFISDNEWSSQLQCTPAATDPPDYTCPAADQGVAPGSAPGVPADEQMTAADVAYVVNWEKQTGITLNMAFNGIGACTAPSAADESSANCTGSITDNGATYTDPGQAIDSSYPNDAGLVNALIADQADFTWIIHTWSHLFLGCQVWSPQALTSVTANASGGTFTAGAYSYEVTAATAYGESEPSTPQSATVGANGSVTLTWPEAINGTGTNGTPGPSLAQEEASHTGGTGFWGYNVYRENPGSTTYGLVGQVAENPAATSATTYSFTDTGTAPGAGPDSGPDFPTATNPGIDCSDAPGSWVPETSTAADSSIEQEIGLDQAWAAANGLTNYTPAAVVTGEHSGVESPNMPTALNGTNVTTFAQDASRQPQQYTLGNALGAPRYPSNIYYNAANWPDELNEYNTLYVAQGDPVGNSQFPSETGHCTDTSATTCISTPATEASLLASESHIMLTHVLGNNPRVGYAHQTDLIGPATQNGQDYGYTILDLISNMLAQYDGWYTAAAPLDQMTDVTEAQVLAEQGAWATAETAGNYTATESNGTVTVKNTGSAVNIPITVPSGTTVNGAAFGQAYGGDLSNWVNLGTGSTETLSESVAPVITSAASATSIVGSAFSFTVNSTGEPTAALTEAGALPSGITFTDNGNGTATIAGTAASGTGGSFPITITAKNATGTATQSFTLTNAEAPAITSASTAAFSTGVAGTYTVTTTGYPAATITETGTLPSGLTFTPGANGTATIAGTAAAGTAGSYPVTIKATNTSGSTATLALTITVTTSGAPTITSPATADFTAGSAGAVAITTTGSPTAKITETGALPAGLTFTDNGNGTALLSGTATSTGTTPITITAANGISPNATQSFTIVVGQAPAFTSASTATGSAGSAFSFTVTAGGYPAPSFGWSNTPPGLTFTDNHNGTATLAGTPTTAGTYAMPLSAASAYGTAQQTLTVTVQQAPAITSGNAATLTIGTAGTFTVTGTGSPAPTFTESGALPSGVTFTGNANSTATLAGTPAAGTSGSYPITITAANGVGSNATQSFTLTVQAAPLAPTITSGNAATFTAGTAGTFSVTSTGSPAATLTESGTLPAGVTFTGSGNGTATLAGTPTASGSYPITITAANGVGSNATQSFTLTVNPAAVAPLITSASATTFAAGSAGTFTVTSTGTPTAALSATSTPALPAGVTFTDKGNGTGTLAGTPPAGSQGVYSLTVTAKSSAGTATQTLSLTVNSGLAITSAASASATSGKAFSFTVSTTGTPAPTLTDAGTLPSGVTFTAGTNGTATIAGTPAAAAGGPYPITITAKNAAGTASQAFTLTVASPPAVTSAAAVTETAATAFSYTVTATGYPAPTLASGTLPAGVTFNGNGNGTATLAGKLAAGTYTVPVTATNAGGTASQTITVTVKAAGTQEALPGFTSAAAATVTSGANFTFNATTAGYPTTQYTTNVNESGKLPAGVYASNNGDGSNTLTGTPTAASAGVYPITFTATNPSGTVTQSFTLTVTGPPAITSAASATATVGSAFSFTVRATGAPAPALTEAGALPQGLSWADNGNGTATLAGTAGVGQGGVYALTLSAASPLGTVTQKFTLTVDQAPSITSAATAKATHATALTVTFTAAGYPAATLTETGTVPGLTFTSATTGTATLSGTPKTAGTYPLTITAKNSVGTATQTFTLTVS